MAEFYNHSRTFDERKDHFYSFIPRQTEPGWKVTKAVTNDQGRHGIWMLEERSVNEGHTSADDSLLTLQPIFSNGLLGKTWVFTLRDSHSLRLIHLGILIANEITCPNWHVSHKQENQRLNSILHDVVHFQMPSIHQSTCIGTAPTNCFSIYTHQYFAYFSSCV